MVTVRKATADLFDQIHPLLLHFRHTRLDQAQWRRILSIRWSRHHDHFGYVLMQDDQVVGFLGTLFFERLIGDREHRFCDLFCWIVPEEYRQHSLLLLFPVLKLQDTTVMSLTPSHGASLILARFGFTVLETHAEIFPVLPRPGTGRGLRLIREKPLIRDRLRDHDLALFRDHDLPGCEHLLLETDGQEEGSCYLVFNTVRKKGIRFTQVYHVGDPRIFRQGFSRLQWYFLRYNRTLFTLVDRRLLGGLRPGPGYGHVLRHPRLYRPAAGLEPARVDNLYSELLLLRL